MPHSQGLLCSSWDLFHQEIQYLKKFCDFNLFPKNVIDSLTKSFLENIYRPPLSSPNEHDPPPLYIKLPFLCSYYSKLFKELRTTLSKHLPNHSVRIISTNSLSLQSFFRVKESVPIALRSNLVYLYKCFSCDAEYVGQSSLQLRARSSKHMGLSFRTNRPITSPEHSAIRLHAETSNHPFNFCNFKILHSAQTTSDLKILESLYIHTHKPSLNSLPSFNLLLTT